MNAYLILKEISGLVVSAGVGTVVGNAIKHTTPKDVSKYTKVLITIGGSALGGMAGQKVAQHTKEQLDEIKDLISEAIDPETQSNEQ